jgi:putative ABC transport system substrate-binding protein
MRGLALVLALLLAPLETAAQPAERVYRLGWLSVGSPSAAVEVRRAFREGLRQLGYAEGRTLVVEERFAEGRLDRLRDLAAELVRLKVDVIVTQGTPAGLAAKQATTAIPIVSVGTGDPVGSGLVDSLARPGGNVTGITAAYRDIAAKCVELLREVVPRMSRVGFLGNAANAVNRTNFEHAQAAAGTLGLTMEYFSATRPAEVAPALAAMGKASVQGVVVSGDAVITSRQKEIIEYVERARLPAVYFIDDYVDLGGLMSYGPSRRDLFRQAAGYVDRILKGTRPADLPVEQPMKLALVVNLKTAKALGLKIPPAVLLRADQVLE